MVFKESEHPVDNAIDLPIQNTEREQRELETTIDSTSSLTRPEFTSCSGEMTSADGVGPDFPQNAFSSSNCLLSEGPVSGRLSFLTTLGLC